MYICMYVCIYMYVCMYICMYVCIYVCMYVYIYISLHFICLFFRIQKLIKEEKEKVVETTNRVVVRWDDICDVLMFCEYYWGKVGNLNP